MDKKKKEMKTFWNKDELINYLTKRNDNHILQLRKRGKRVVMIVDIDASFLAKTVLES